jgi:hypothetical protein
MLALRQIVVASCHCDDSFCMLYKKKKWVITANGIRAVSSRVSRKSRVVLKSKDKKRALGF